MAGYVIYLPGLQGANPAHLDNVGLTGLSDGGLSFGDCLEGGPDKGHGLMAVWQTGNPESDPSFVASHYQWQPAKACKARNLSAKRFWLGTDPKRLVKPADIARKTFTQGHWLDLRDGNTWYVPAAVNLPHTHGLNDDGEFDRQVSEQYRDFWAASEQYAVEFFRAIDHLDLLKQQRPKTNTELHVDFTLKDGWEFCCRALSINYRLTPEIVDMLGLLDDMALRNIIKAAIDLPIIFEVRNQKKTDAVSIPVG